jgi:hypothetical protein
MNHSLPFLNERPSLLHRATSASDRDVGLWPSGSAAITWRWSLLLTQLSACG